MTHSSRRHPIHHPDTASRIYSGEAVIISPAENRVRMLNPVGSRIWELADGNRTVTEMAEVLTGEYDVSLEQALQSVDAFLAELETRDLIAWR